MNVTVPVSPSRGDGRRRRRRIPACETCRTEQQVKRVHWYPRYVRVDEQRARTVSEINRLLARGVQVQPVALRGRTVARYFWGRRWCEHVESFSEYAARLAHGRAYLRNGCVCHLSIKPGGIDAMVSGSALYQVSLRIRRLDRAAWTAIGTACAGRIDSLVELHQGGLSDDIAEVVTHRDSGLFPQPGEIVASCECGDATPMCKHAAAVLSGIGSRLDERPELLFLLRGVDETALVGGEPARSRDTVAAGGLEPDATNGAASSHAVDSRPLNTPGPADSKAMPAGAPTSTDSATSSRPVKKTLTYRPPIRAAAGRRPTRSDLANEAAGFAPTGEMVGDLREQCGCSVAEFADLLQVTPTTVRRWESTPGPLNLHAAPWEALRALCLESRQHPR